MRLSNSVITHAEHFELRIGPRANPLVGLEQIVRALDREVRGLNRHEQVRRGHHGVHGENAQRRRRVDNDVVVVLQDRRNRVLELERRVKLPGKLLLELGQRQPRRRHGEHGVLGRLDDAGHFGAVIAEHVEHRRLHVGESRKK